MPELPDIEVYLHALASRVVGRDIGDVRVTSISAVKTWDPPIDRISGRRVDGLRRVGKRVVFELGDDWLLSIHLMISGRLQWKPPGTRPPARVGHLAIDVGDGCLVLTEASTKKRAAVHLVVGEAALAALDRGGIEPLGLAPDVFAERLRARNRTLKRALTDPAVFAGIGNAYSDEILHRARLSPVQRTGNLSDVEVAGLQAAVEGVLGEWRDRLIEEVGDGWPTKVTAFRPEMAVHGRFREPCPVCGAAVQRIVHADAEMNYCPGCQTGGRVLADRSLSRLLGDDWEGLGLTE